MAMDITFTCPHCGEVTLIDETFVGQSGECRACGKVVTVPPVMANANRSGSRLQTSGGFLTWCNNYLGYALIGVFVLGVLIALLAPELEPGRHATRRMSR